MPIIAAIVPAATVLVLVLICVLPWGMGESLRFVLPVLPFSAIYFWSRTEAPMPSTLVFLAGLIVDVLTYGPLGYWSLIYLIGMALTAGLDQVRARNGSLSRWVDFCAVLVLLSIVAWLIASAYFVFLIEWRPMLLAAVAVAALYPLISTLLKPFEMLVRGPQPLNLERKV